MYYFVKLSNKWYGRAIKSLSGNSLRDVQEHVNACEMVVIADSKEEFAEQIGISVDDIEKI